jgi:hypothetical protein
VIFGIQEWHLGGKLQKCIDKLSVLAHGFDIAI